MLRVKLLDNKAIAPTVGHPGEDLGYDLYSMEDGTVPARGHRKLRTGVAVEFTLEHEPDLKWGMLAQERSSMAERGLFIMGGVIDAGYRGEIYLMLGSLADEDIDIKAGDKIANLVPIPVVAKKTDVVPELALSARGGAGFGSTDS